MMRCIHCSDRGRAPGDFAGRILKVFGIGAVWLPTRLPRESSKIRIVCLLLLMPLFCEEAETAEEGAVQRIELRIEERLVKRDSDTVVVSQGATVELHWRSDEQVRVHIHGYNIAQLIDAGTPVVTRFHAFATGRFPITSHGFGDLSNGSGDHGGHRNLLYLEVHP